MEVTLLLEDMFFPFLLWFFWFGALLHEDPGFLVFSVLLWFFCPPEDTGFFRFHRTLVFPLPEDHVFSSIVQLFATVVELFLAWGGPREGTYVNICVYINIYAYVCVCTYVNNK